MVYDCNVVEIMGTLGDEPKFKKTQNTNRSMVTFSVRVRRRPSSTSTDKLMIQAWEDLADMINENYHQGDRIGIRGKMVSSYYRDGDVTKYFTRVVAYELLDVDEIEDPSAFGFIGYDQAEANA